MADKKQVIYASGIEKAPTNDPPPGTKSRRVDEAMKAFDGHEGQVLELDEATSKRLLRTIDLHLMPVIRFRSRPSREWGILMTILIAFVHGIRSELPR